MSELAINGVLVTVADSIQSLAVKPDTDSVVRDTEVFGNMLPLLHTVTAIAYPVIQISLVYILFKV